MAALRIRRRGLSFARVAVALIALAILAAFALGACGGDSPEPTPEPTPTPVNPAVLLAESGAAMSALRSFRFRLTHNEGGTPLADGLSVSEAEGAVVSPDRISVDFTGTFGSFAIRSGIISIGGDGYMTNPLTGEWESVAAEVSPLAFFDPQSGIGAIMQSVRNPALVSADADDAYAVEGDMSASALAPILGGLTADGDVRVTLAIAADSRFLEKAVINGRVTANEEDGLTRTVTLWDFDAPISIDPPSG